MKKCLLPLMFLMLLIVGAVGCQNTDIAEPTEEAPNAVSEPGDAIDEADEEPAEQTPDTVVEPEEAGSDAETEPTELRIVMGHVPVSPNFALDTSLEALPVYGNMYETVMAVRDGEQVPILAESWEPIEETTWQLKLRSGVPWQCGGEFSAEDVKFTIDWHLDPDVESQWKGRLGGITEVEVVDDLTVNIHTDGPQATVISNLAFIYIYPKEYFESVGLDGFVEEPCGTGPYRMIEWIPDDYYILEAFEDYWNGEPNIDRVTITKIAEEATRVAMFEAGEADVVYGISLEEANRLEEDGYKIDITPTGRTEVFTIRATLDTPFQDQRVRQAANYCVDIEEMNEVLLGGYGRLASQLVGPDAFGYNPDLEPYPFDPELGKQLLAEAGYPDGFEAQMTGSIGYYFKDKEVSETVAAQLEANCGIRINLQLLESSAWLDNYFGGTHPELFIIEWNYAPAMDADANALFFMSQEIHQRDTTILDDEELNELFLQQRATLDPQERLEILQEMEARIHELAPAIFLWQAPNVAAIQPNVSNLTFRGDKTLELMNAVVE